jgi:predicted nucleic acid-binding Zn finger protein
MVEHGKFTFSMAPTGGVKWYEGEVLTKDGRITGGKCSCPHWKKGGVKYRGVQMCKHMIAIQMDINVGKDEEVVALVLPGGTVDDVVSEVIVNGVSKPFKGTQTEAEARLERAGFKHDKTVAYGRPGMATLHQIWRKSVERTAST